MLHPTLLQNIHLEITNKCNSRCPGCARTLDGDTHPLLKPHMMQWSLNDFQKFFDPKFIDNKLFTFGGVVDEPFMNTHIMDIVDYILKCNGYIEIFTNTGANTKEVFETFGKWSKQTGRLDVKFSVDGLEDTNHLYRVNVDWHKVIENMTAYATQGGKCEWQYLVFEHNEKDIDDAKNIADSLGVPFVLRQNVRNIAPWTAVAKKKIDGKIVEETFTVNPTKNKSLEHPDTDKVANWKENFEISEQDKAKSIRCKMFHEKEIFVDWSGRVFPCCWFASDYFFDADHHLKEVDIEYGDGWNSLHLHTLEEIMAHEYYAILLQKSWQRGSKFYSSDCFKKCGDKGARQSYQYTTL